MSDAYTNLLVHVVFSTKNRDKSLTAAVRKELYPYVIALSKECRAPVYAVNGGLEHVHVLLSIPPSKALSDVIRFLKTNSSRWIRETFNRHFNWQAGYAAMSVSRSRLSNVCEYIEHQEKHHKRMSYEHEFVSLLRRNEIEFENERLWA